MQTFGYKFTDQSVTRIAPVTEAALRAARPLEVGLYFHDPEVHAYLRDVLPNSGLRINTHLDHNLLHVQGIHLQQDRIRAEIDCAQTLGSTYSITHVAAYPLPRRAAMQATLWEHLADNLALLNDIAAAQQHPIHIENTFHSLDFYVRLMNLITRNGYDQLHFCFDIGHAKVWSEQTLPMWLDFLYRLDQRAIRIHFHLHANQGMSDEHLSFIEAEAAGITGADAYTDTGDYYAALHAIQQRFPKSRKVFEVKPHLALENLNLVMRRLQAINNPIPTAV